MSTQHTPGPWRAIKWSFHAATTVVAEVLGHQVVIAECGGSGRYLSESIGDALLIAAAPEMLAELQRLAGYLRSPYFDEGMRYAVATGVEAVIAKATGSAA